MRLLGVRFRIISYNLAIPLGSPSPCPCPSLCPPEWIFPMDLFDGSFRIDLSDGYLCVPLNGSLSHRFCGTYVFTNHHLCVNPQPTPVKVCDYVYVVNFFSHSYLFCLESFFFLLTCFPLLGSVRVITPMMRSLNIQKIDPWFGLVRKSPVISPVGHHSTDMSPLRILSVIKIT